MICPICGAAHISCGGPKPTQISEDSEMLVTSIQKNRSVGDDYIANEDIFIDAEGKVVDKKDARTKLASRGSRVTAEDVERYNLSSPTPPLIVHKFEELETKMVSVSPASSPAEAGGSAPGKERGKGIQAKK